MFFQKLHMYKKSWLYVIESSCVAMVAVWWDVTLIRLFAKKNNNWIIETVRSNNYRHKELINCYRL